MGSKKGQTTILVGIVLLVLLTVVMIVGFSLNNVVQELNDEIQNTDFHNESKAVMSSQANSFPSFMDGLFLIALGIAIIGGIVGSYFLDEAPVWLVLDVLFFAFLIIGAAAMSNVYEDYASADVYSGYDTSFPITNWAMNNLVIIIGGYVGIILTAVIIKQRTLI